MSVCALAPSDRMCGRIGSLFACANSPGLKKKKRKITKPKQRDELGTLFDRNVTVAVAQGEHEEDAIARIILQLIDGKKDVVRILAATQIGSSNVVEDIMASQVQLGRPEFERGLEFIVGRGTFSHKTYSDVVQPTVNKMLQVCS